MVYNAIMANGKPPKYFVDKYCDQLEKEKEERERREREERAKAQKDGSRGGDVKREDYGKILTHEEMKELEFRMVPGEGYVRGYGAGLAELRRLCSKDRRSAQPKVEVYGDEFVRPLTVREYLLARIIDYERRYEDGKERTIDDRLRLFNKCSFTSTGLIYFPGYNKVKVHPICVPLLSLGEDFRGAGIEVDSDNIDGDEIDLARGKYGEWLSRSELGDHKGWIKLVGDDQEGRRILGNYADIVFSEVQRLYKEDKAMGFWSLWNITTTQVRAPWISDLDNFSNASCNNNLNYDVAFLRVSHAA